MKNFNVPGFAKTLIFLSVILFLLTMCTNYDCGFREIEDSVVAFGPKLIIIFFLFIVTNLVSSSLKILITRRDGEDSRIMRMLSYFRYLAWIVFLFVAATIAFEDPGALLTSFGLIGFGVTFALQKPILNFVGWLNISLNRSFKVGDRIKVGQIAGDVVEIKMMHTTVKSLLDDVDQHSGKLVSIPNELLLVEPVENYTKEDNFIKSDMSISITYESDWRKAKKIFEEIVNDVTKKNLHKYKKNLSRKLSFIDETIEKLSERFERTQKRKREKKLKEHIDALEKEKEGIKETFEDMPGWFRPKTYVEMSDSCIKLSAVFSVPYDMVRIVKTEINSAFLDAVRKERDVDIAYPHLQIVTGEKSKRVNRVLTEFMGIDNISLKAE